MPYQVFQTTFEQLPLGARFYLTSGHALEGRRRWAKVLRQGKPVAEQDTELPSTPLEFAPDREVWTTRSY